MEIFAVAIPIFVVICLCLNALNSIFSQMIILNETLYRLEKKGIKFDE